MLYVFALVVLRLAEVIAHARERLEQDVRSIANDRFLSRKMQGILCCCGLKIKSYQLPRKPGNTMAAFLALTRMILCAHIVSSQPPKKKEQRD
jgi:hypothetical protein